IEDSEVSFDYKINSSAQFYASPFGLTSIWFNIPDNNFIGIGATLTRFTGSISGDLFYNDISSFQSKHYKLCATRDENDDLRIDFFKISSFKTNDDSNVASPVSLRPSPP
ncbi:uncharacterized protein ASCRUDRAFT_16388, partial [Ascoidea rubescens DSM 1968]